MRSLLSVLTLLVAGPALAQMVGTPSTGPLFPGGPRQGIGPPSITDSVPDIRLRQDGGGIPGAGPPIDYGVRSRPGQSFGNPGMGARAARGMPAYMRAAGRHCETPRSTCVLAKAASLGAVCSCRVRGKAARVRGTVAY